MSEFVSGGNPDFCRSPKKRIKERLISAIVIGGLVASSPVLLGGELAVAESVSVASRDTDYDMAADATHLALQQIFPRAEDLIKDIAKRQIQTAGDLAVDKAQAMFVVQAAANNDYKKAYEIFTFLEDRNVKKRAKKAIALAKTIEKSNGNYSEVMKHWGYFYDGANKAHDLFKSKIKN